MAAITKILPQPKLLPFRGIASRSKFTEFREQVLLALDTLRLNPLLSSLTILGIVIGIMTVITVSSVINGLNENVLGGIRDLGSDTIICYRFPWASLSRPPSEWLHAKSLKRNGRKTWPYCHTLRQHRHHCAFFNRNSVLGLLM